MSAITGRWKALSVAGALAVGCGAPPADHRPGPDRLVQPPGPSAPQVVRAPSDATTTALAAPVAAGALPSAATANGAIALLAALDGIAAGLSVLSSAPSLMTVPLGKMTGDSEGRVPQSGPHETRAPPKPAPRPTARTLKGG
jgi:hypothetical protein